MSLGPVPVPRPEELPPGDTWNRICPACAQHLQGGLVGLATHWRVHHPHAPRPPVDAGRVTSPQHPARSALRLVQGRTQPLRHIPGQRRAPVQETLFDMEDPP